MSAQIIDGKLTSQKIKDNLKIKITKYTEETGKNISLAVILVGENPASQVYVKNKIKSCEYVGIKSLAYYLPENSTQEEVEKDLEGLQTMRVLGRNMAWILKCIEIGKENNILIPEPEARIATNFITKDR